MNKISDLRMIEIELFNQCNRVCSFCPNKFIPERRDEGKAEFLSKSILHNLILELKNNKFEGTISFSRYNEPFMYPDRILSAAFLIRSIYRNTGLKTPRLVCNTNGDFLSGSHVLLWNLDEVSIMDYDNKGQAYWVDTIATTYHDAKIKQSTNSELIYEWQGTTISVLFDFLKNATVEDRGGTLDSVKNMKNDHDLRVRPCHEPKYFLGIDYNGYVMPCCNMRSDFHMEFNMGNLYRETLVDIVEGSTRLAFIDEAKQVGMRPCLRCQKDPGRYTRDNPGIEHGEERLK